MSNDVILRNSLAEQYICAARKNFLCENVVSESESKMLIGHFSDIHGDVKRFENAMKLFEYYKPEFVIHTGDNVTWNMSDDYQFITHGLKNLSVPAYNCIGNHDTFANNDTIRNATTKSNEFLHNEFIEPLKNIKTEGKNGYYYVDFDARLVRLIVLNNYEYECTDPTVRDKYSLLQQQCDWFINVLKEAAEKEYAVIVASHEKSCETQANDFGFYQRFSPHPWGMPKKNPEVVEDIIDAFKHGKTIEQEYFYELIDKRVKISTTFEKKGEFVCYMTGHRHGDYIGYLTKYPDQLSLAITCSGCFPAEYHNIGGECSDLPRIPDTISEDAINFYILDTNKKEITIVRAGASINDELKKRVVLRLPYGKVGK